MAMYAMREVHESAIIRHLVPLDEMEGFMETFQEEPLTRGEEEDFRAWAGRHRIQCKTVHTETDIALFMLMFSPVFQHVDFRAEALYMVGDMMHGGEREYLNFLAFVSR